MRHQLNFQQRIAFNIRRVLTEPVKEAIAVFALTGAFGYIGYLMLERL